MLDTDALGITLAEPRGKKGYLALPNKENPKLVLPVEPLLRKAGLRLYEPLKLTGQIWKRLLLWGWVRGEPVDVPEAGLLKGLLQAVVGQEVEIAFWIAPPGAYQKLTIEAMDSRGQVLAYAKLARKPLAIRALENEKKVLQMVSGFGDVKVSVPQVLAWEAWCDARVLVLTPGPDRPGPKQFGLGHDRFLQKLQHRFPSETKFKESGMWKNIQGTYNEVALLLPRVWRERYERIMKLLNNELGSEGYRLTLAHRDFTPWNTREFPDGRLFVFDWEFGSLGYLPSYDRIHFNFMGRLLSVPSRPLMPRRRDKSLLEYVAYLLDLSLLYHHFLFARGGSREDDVLRACAQELDAVIRGI